MQVREVLNNENMKQMMLNMKCELWLIDEQQKFFP